MRARGSLWVVLLALVASAATGCGGEVEMSLDGAARDAGRADASEGDAGAFDADAFDADRADAGDHDANALDAGDADANALDAGNFEDANVPDSGDLDDGSVPDSGNFEDANVPDAGDLDGSRPDGDIDGSALDATDTGASDSDAGNIGGSDPDAANIDGTTSDATPLDGGVDGSDPDAANIDDVDGSTSDAGPLDGDVDGSAADAGNIDGSTATPLDGDVDGSTSDAGNADGSTSDAGPLDGNVDGSDPDAGDIDGSTSDAGPRDSNVDGSDPDPIEPDAGEPHDAGPITLLPALLPPARACEYYRATINATGGTGAPPTWSTRPTFPPGLTLTGSGLTATIHGYPRRNAAGSYNFRARVDEPTGGFDLQVYTIDIAEPAPDLQKYAAVVGDLDTAGDQIYSLDLCSPPDLDPVPLNAAPHRVLFAGANRAAGVSPDGSRVAFIGYNTTTGPSYLYIASITSTIAHSGIPVAAGPNIYPHSLWWSPDGSKIAVRGHDGFIRRVWVTSSDAAGNFGPLVEASGPMVPGGEVETYSDLQFSPDSQKISFRADADVDNQFNLYVVDVSTPIPGPRMRIGPTPTEPWVNVFDRWLWSPDSSRVYYRRAGATLSQTYLSYVDVSGPVPGPPIEITAPPPNAGELSSFENAYALSPDGTKIFFCAGDYSAGQFELFLTDVSGPMPVFLETLSPPLPGGSTAYGRWSPDSTRILFLADAMTDGINELFLADLSGPGPAVVNRVNPFTPGGNAIARFAWSPDGTKVAYDDAIGQLWISDLSGAPPWPTTIASNQAVYSMTWSPDASRTLHLGLIGHTGLYQIEPTAPTVLATLTPNRVEWHAWASYGRRIYFLEVTPARRAFMIDLDNPSVTVPFTGPLAWYQHVDLVFIATEP